jgi:NAD(P)-dependent dehydrogenase (short-subunit alcohol dehydrogenase family)
LGHFVLVNRIASLLKPGSRLVSLSSSGHRFSDVDLDDPNFEHTSYTEFGAYGRSKTANILFAVEFDRRHKANGVRATAVHPGGIKTELGRHLSPEAIQQLIDQINTANSASGAPGLRLENHPARRGDLGLERHRGLCRSIRSRGQSDPSSRPFDRRDSKSAANQLSGTGSAVESS